MTKKTASADSIRSVFLDSMWLLGSKELHACCSVYLWRTAEAARLLPVQAFGSEFF